MTKIDFKTSNYFAGHIYYSGFVFIAIGLVIIGIKPILGLIICLVNLVVVTTHYRLGVDLNNRTYHDYLWILGFKRGERVKFDSIEYLFIKKINVSQTMNLRVASSTIQKEVYDGYVKFSGQENLHLLTLDDRGGLIKKMKDIAGQLKVGVVDYSNGQPVEI